MMKVFELTHHVTDVIVPIIVVMMLFYILFLKRRMFMMSLHQFQLARAQKKIQINLRNEQDQSEIRLDAIELALDGIAILTHDGILLYGNRALWSIFDVPYHKKSLYVGKSWLHLYGEKGQAFIHEIILPALEIKGEWRSEGPVQLHNGLVIHGEMSLKRTQNGNIIGMMRDVSDRVMAERARDQLRVKEWQDNKALAMGRMARGMVHDLNNALASVMGYAEFLSDDLNPQSDQGRYVRAILESTYRMSHILDQIAVLAPKPVAIPDHCDAIEVVKNILVRQEFFDHHIFDTSLTRAIIPISKIHFTRIIEEILKNAQQASPGENFSLAVDLFSINSELTALPFIDDTAQDQDHLPLDIQSNQDDRSLLVLLGGLYKHQAYLTTTIEDKGSGLTTDTAMMIFDPFFSTKTVQEHPGLGLAVVRGLVTLYKGALEIYSTPQKGTRVKIFIPLINRQSYELIKITEPSYDLIGKHVVIVDDQISILNQMTESLTRQKIKVSAFLSGFEALDFIRDQRANIDLVITDHQMPELSGGELAAELKADFNDLPIVLMSGFDPDLLPPQIDSFLKKPLAVSALRHTMQRLIGKSMRV